MPTNIYGFICYEINHNQFKLINIIGSKQNFNIKGNWNHDKDKMFVVSYYGHIVPKEIYYLEIIPIGLTQAKNFNEFIKYILQN